VLATCLERGVSVDHSTIQRWGERYAGELEPIFWKKHKRCGASISWRMEKPTSSLKVSGAVSIELLISMTTPWISCFQRLALKKMFSFKVTSIVSTIAAYALINMLKKGQFDNAQGMNFFEKCYALAA
jgi:hypothetical protein